MALPLTMKRDVSCVTGAGRANGLALLGGAVTRPATTPPTVIAPAAEAFRKSLLSIGLSCLQEESGNPKQLQQVAAENGGLFRISQRPAIDDEVDADRPVVRVVGAIENPVDAEQSDKLPQTWLIKDHRVDVELAA